MKQVASIKTDRSLMPLARLIKDTSKQAFLSLLITSRECRLKIDESYFFALRSMTAIRETAIDMAIGIFSRV